MINTKLLFVALALIMFFCRCAPARGDTPPDTAYVGYAVDEAGGHPMEVMVQHVMIPDDSAMLATGMRRFGGVYVGLYLAEDTMRIYDGSTPNYVRAWPLEWKLVIITTGDVTGDQSVDISDLVYMIDFMFGGVASE
jgi:hypothetical protein